MSASVSELPWGRRYLMCPPLHFGVLYEINPWMHTEVQVDVDGAEGQWEALVANLQAAGAEVVTMEPAEHVPDLVFTANAGLVSRQRVRARRTSATPSASPRRRCSRPGSRPPASSCGGCPTELDHEGAGDALPFFDEAGRAVLLSGYRPRSDAAAGPELAELLGVPGARRSSSSTSGCTTST